MLTFPLVIYSKSAEYAIQAMIYLTENVSDKPTMIHKIAKEYNIPYHFLAKIMQTLVKHHLVKATRGRAGGINLGRAANKIYLDEIVFNLNEHNMKCHYLLQTSKYLSVPMRSRTVVKYKIP